jgi:predicted nucleotidyltransferase
MEAQVTVRTRRRQEADRVLTLLKEALPAVLTGYPVDAAYVYGSVARGAVTPFSDVDIALLLTVCPPPYERLKLELAIQADIEDAVDLAPIDVRTLNDAPLMVQAQVVQHGVLLYERDRRRSVDFEVATRKRYFDFAPVARRLGDAFLEHVRREGMLRGRSEKANFDSE